MTMKKKTMTKKRTNTRLPQATLIECPIEVSHTMEVLHYTNCKGEHFYATNKTELLTYLSNRKDFVNFSVSNDSVPTKIMFQP